MMYLRIVIGLAGVIANIMCLGNKPARFNAISAVCFALAYALTGIGA